MNTDTAPIHYMAVPYAAGVLVLMEDLRNVDEQTAVGDFSKVMTMDRDQAVNLMLSLLDCLELDRNEIGEVQDLLAKMEQVAELRQRA